MITENSKNILLVDDSIFFRAKLSDILIEAGHKVRFSGDGSGVINEIKVNYGDIDLLILDLILPDIDALGILSWLKENGYSSKFPVVAITRLYEPQDVVKKLKDNGISGLITREFTPEQIVLYIHSLLFPEKINKGALRKRAPVAVPVDFTVEDLTRTGFLLNVSDTGVFLHTDVKLIMGTRVNLQFSLRGLNKILDINGVVVWSTHERTNKGFFYGYGISFTSISKEDREILRNFVDAEVEKLKTF